MKRLHIYTFDFQQYETIRSFGESILLIKLISMGLKWIKAIY